MTPEQQRVAIAEWCGWKAVRMEGSTMYGIDSPKAHHAKPVPDYLHDLNAIHEAEKKLIDKQISQYVANMWRAMHLSQESAIGTIHANAAQRSEALLRTLNLWKDS